MNSILQALIPLLPRYTQDGSYASRVSREEVLTALKNQMGEEKGQAVETTLELVENMMTSFCLLDADELEREEWKFISHPAQLCALSLLHTLADPRQKLFAPDFWHTSPTMSEHEKQQQKQILEALENRRDIHHLDGKHYPIRFVYVAWGVIKLDDKFLFHQSSAKEYEKDYRLLGGRVKPQDLKAVMGIDVSTDDLLKALQTPDSKTMFNAFPVALHREFEAKAKLSHADGHYKEDLWQNISAYYEVRGGAPNYALSQYYFRLYHVKLNNTGYFALRKELQSNERLILCSIDEVVRGKTDGGSKDLTPKAIIDHFENNPKKLRQALNTLESSYTNRYIFNDKKYSLIFSLEKNILRGTSGKEEALLTTLNSEQKSLLLALAAHGKGLTITPTDSNAVDFHEFGWIAVHDETLQNKLEQLTEQLRQANCAMMEVTQPNYFRLSLSPELIFFDYDFFRHQVQEMGTLSNPNKWRITIYRNLIETSLGKVQVCSEYGDISSKANRTTHDGDSAESAGARICALSNIMKRSDYQTIDEMEWRKIHQYDKPNEEFIKDTLRSLNFQKYGLKDLLIAKKFEISKQKRDSVIRTRVFLSCLPLTNDVDDAGD